MLKKRIQKREAIIGVIGMGYVGIPLTLTFLKANFTLLGFDIDKDKINALNQGLSYIKQYPAKLFFPYLKKKKFSATADFARLAEVDCIIICVPTPLTKMKDPDLTYIINTTQEIATTLRKGQLDCFRKHHVPRYNRRTRAPKIRRERAKG